MEDPDHKRLKELNAYLERKPASKTVPVMDWWHVNGSDFPTVELMWRQFHARPASSAGVERLFCGAGKMHGDDAQNLKSESIQNALICAKNYNPWEDSDSE